MPTLQPTIVRVLLRKSHCQIWDTQNLSICGKSPKFGKNAFELQSLKGFNNSGLFCERMRVFCISHQKFFLCGQLIYYSYWYDCRRLFGRWKTIANRYSLSIWREGALHKVTKINDKRISFAVIQQKKLKKAYLLLSKHMVLMVRLTSWIYICMHL